VGGGKSPLPTPQSSRSRVSAGALRLPGRTTKVERERVTHAARPELTVCDLVVEFQAGRRPPVRVLDHVSFDVSRKEFVAVMGPSGCGKSTLLNVLAGFRKPTHGTAEHGDRLIEGPGPERGMVFQAPALYPWMTVLENVLFGPKATGRGHGATDRALQLLEEVGLGGFERHRPYELSGGMKHRAALARTLVNEPPVLLMDEPFAALDAQTRVEMQSLLLSMWERHKSTAVFVTHDIEEGLFLADRVVILTHRPGAVREILTVDAPRPRTADLVLTEDFIQLRKYVRSLMSRAMGDPESPATSSRAPKPSALAYNKHS
jgi:NitT/TauT family transport system ATP-binding protein